MAVAPAIGIGLSAVGTISGINQANRQADAQRQSIEAQRLAAQQQYELSRQRFESSRETSEQIFARELMVVNELNTQARQQLELQALQQGIQNSAIQMQQAQQLAGIDEQINQLITAAANVRTEAGVSNIQDLVNLSAMMEGTQDQGNQFIQRLVATNQDPRIAQQFLEESLLQQIANFQGTQETVATRNRVAGAQAGALESQANIQERYRDAVNDFFTVENAVNKQFQDFVNQKMPSLLDLQHQRNIKSLEAAKFANQAELNIANQASALQFQNQNRQLNAQAAGIQGANVFGALGQLGTQAVSLLNFQPSVQPIFASGGGGLGGGIITDFTGSNIFA